MKTFIRCRNCSNLMNDWCDKKFDSPDPDMERECPYFAYNIFADNKPIKTNYDLYRECSLEQLADLFNRIETEGRAYGPRGKYAWLKWLREKHEDEPC